MDEVISTSNEKGLRSYILTCSDCIWPERNTKKHVTNPEGHENQDTKKAELALIRRSSKGSRHKKKTKKTTMVNVLLKQDHKSFEDERSFSSVFFSKGWEWVGCGNIDLSGSQFDTTVIFLCLQLYKTVI